MNLNGIAGVVLLGLALVICMPVHAAVRAELDRNRITEGETVMLTFLTDDPKQNMDADFSVLEKDFDILDQRTETQLSIVSGRQTAVVRLLLTLEPKAVGAIVIPPLKVGGGTTRALTVTVEPAPQLEPGSQPPVFLEVEIVPEDGPFYVHAQLGLVVRVFYQQNLTEAAISPPEPSPAVVRLLQETPYQAERGGERYRVLERHYAVFPERSGELSLPPMQLTGRLVERRSTSVWQPAVRGRRIQVESEALLLDIEPKPLEFSGSEWQPARDFRLTQQISSGESLRVGEPVTRTVIIDAVGLEENMLVEPVWPEMENVRIYPDQPQGITRDDGQWVLGHKEFRYAVVPETEGALVLPELKVEWWDTVNHRLSTAVLAAQTIQVLPSTLVPPPPAPSGVPDISALDTAVNASQAPAGNVPYWRWLAFLFAALWLVTLAAWLILRGRSPQRSGDHGTAQQADAGERQLLKSLQQACMAGDRRPARKLLMRWLSRYSRLEGQASLLDFANRLDEQDLRDSLLALDSEGFRRPDTGNSNSWNGSEFWQQFDRWRKARETAERGNPVPLTDLYASANRGAA